MNAMVMPCLLQQSITMLSLIHILGYPSEDVSGFIKHGAKNSKCVGTWKVYGDEAEAQKKFKLYKMCIRDRNEAANRCSSRNGLPFGSGGVSMKPLWHMIEPVSYTHLDVYKRQVPKESNLALLH